jgi:hypothetical protein
MRLTKFGKTLLQIATVVFFINAATAYGSCCLVMPASHDSVVSEMPCHQAEDDHDGTSSPDDCCLLCVSMTGHTYTARYFNPHEPILDIPATTSFVVATADPPYRPPISHLS